MKFSVISTDNIIARQRSNTNTYSEPVAARAPKEFSSYMRVAKTSREMQTFFQQLLSRQTDIAGSLRRLQNVFTSLQMVDKVEAMRVFEDYFGSKIPKADRLKIYNLAVEIATEFCKDLASSGKEGKEIDIFPFPFTSVPLSDFESVNAIWRAMDRALGKDEGPRFVHSDRLFFGLAREYYFKGVPVTQFTKILAGSGSIKYSDQEASETKAFVFPGVERIFVLANQEAFESHLQRTQDLKIARAMWNYAAVLINEPSITSARFADTVNDLMFFQRLLHEFGHLLSFKDKRVADFVLKPVLSKDGKEYLHPAFERFRDLGEVYAELFGVMDRIIEDRDALFFIFSFAYYARNLSSRRKHARASAFALVPLLRRNFSFDSERKKITINWDGLRRDVEAQKTFLCGQFEAYGRLSEEEERAWIDNGSSAFHAMSQLSEIVGGKRPDPSNKPQVEAVFRDQAVAQLGLELRIHLATIHPKVADERKKWRELFDKKDAEAGITRTLPEVADGLLTEYAGETVENCIAETLQLGQVSRGSFPFVAGADLSSYINTVNELMRDADRVSSSFYARELLKEDPMISRDLFWFGDGYDEMWAYLLREKYIEGGNVLPKFDGVLENFTVPQSLSDLKGKAFRFLQEAVNRKKRHEQNLLTPEELREAAQRVERILARFSDDPLIQPKAKEVLQMIQKDLENLI